MSLTHSLPEIGTHRSDPRHLGPIKMLKYRDWPYSPRIGKYEVETLHCKGETISIFEVCKDLL